MAQPHATQQPPHWDEALQQLLVMRIIDGYALLAHTGVCVASYGRLEEEMWGEEGAPSAAARQFCALFQSRERGGAACVLLDQGFGRHAVCARSDG